MDTQTGTITVKLHAGYPGSEAAASTGGFFTDARLQLFDRDTPTLKPGAPDYSVASLEPAGDRSVRVSFPKWQTGFDLIAVGDRVTLSSRAAEGVSIRNSREVTLEDFHHSRRVQCRHRRPLVRNRRHLSPRARHSRPPPEARPSRASSRPARTG